MNVKGQMRIDVPHLRLIESGVVYDFDTLAGGILAGKLPYVVTGFVPAAWVAGSAASSLSLVTADSIFVNYQASENGSMLMVPADRTPEQLTITNSRVTGNFTVSQTNYVSLDLTKTEDDSTSDVVHFIDPATSQGTPKIIPLGRTMDYQIHITTAPFSTTPQRCPVMIVTTDASNNIVTLVDARPMMFRLAAGGDTPSALSKYAWPEGRNVGVTPANESALFVGGDKAIGDMKSWISAMTEMIWQINAGEYWYSNTQMTSTWFMPGAITDWTWDGTTLTWANPLTIVFTGSTAITNTIAAGSIALLAGNAAYVDFNRYTDGTVLTVYQAAIQTMGGEPATPGIRYPFAWRLAAGSPAIRNLPVPAGASVVGLATTLTSGSVYLNTAAATPYAVVSSGLGGFAVTGGLTRGSLGNGAIYIGNQTTDQSVHVGGASTTYVEIMAVAGSSGISLSSGHDIFVSAGVSSGAGDILLTVPTTHAIYIGSQLLTGEHNTLNIGNLHAGTGYSTILIGTPLADTSLIGNTITIGATTGAYFNSSYIGLTQLGNSTGVTTILGSAVNINATGTNTITIGNTSNSFVKNVQTTGVISITTGVASGSVNIASVGTGGAITLQSVGGCDINSTAGDGQVIIGNATNKARAAAATLSGDNALTLVTKGYVDGFKLVSDFTFTTIASTNITGFSISLPASGIFAIDIDLFVLKDSTAGVGSVAAAVTGGAVVIAMSSMHPDMAGTTTYYGDNTADCVGPVTIITGTGTWINDFAYVPVRMIVETTTAGTVTLSASNSTDTSTMKIRRGSNWRVR